MNVWDNCQIWAGSLIESIDYLVSYILSSVVTTFGVLLNSSNTYNFTEKTSDELLQEALYLFSFDDFQLKLLKVFLAILFGNIVFIFIAWYIYGHRISERFLKPGK